MPFVQSEDERALFRGTTSIRRAFRRRRTLRPDYHQDLALTGDPVPVYSGEGKRHRHFCGITPGDIQRAAIWDEALSQRPHVLWQYPAVYSSRSICYAVEIHYKANNGRVNTPWQL